MNVLKLYREGNLKNKKKQGDRYAVALLFLFLVLDYAKLPNTDLLFSRDNSKSLILLLHV
jgi:hypothetical protein